MSVLVTGARGAVGRHVLDGLLTAGLEVRAASRDPAALDLPRGAAATPVTLDLQRPDTLPTALEGVDAVFCYVTGDLEGFAKAAHDARVDHVVLLSSASVVETDPTTDVLGARHAGAEHTLRQAGLEVTALRPGVFCGNVRQWRHSIITSGIVELPYPHACLAPIHEHDIADAAVAALTTGAGRGTSPQLTGPESLSYTEQVDVLSRELDRDLTVRAIDPDTARQQMLRAGAPPGIVDSLLRLWAAADGVTAHVNDHVEQLTGHPARTFAHWAREHRELFNPPTSNPT